MTVNYTRYPYVQFQILLYEYHIKDHNYTILDYRTAVASLILDEF